MRTFIINFPFLPYIFIFILLKTLNLNNRNTSSFSKQFPSHSISDNSLLQQLLRGKLTSRQGQINLCHSNLKCTSQATVLRNQGLRKCKQNAFQSFIYSAFHEFVNSSSFNFRNFYLIFEVTLIFLFDMSNAQFTIKYIFFFYYKFSIVRIRKLSPIATA